MAIGLLASGAFHGDAEAACDGDTQCSGGPARIMLVLDASSDLLNDGNAAGSEGTTAWDVIRGVIAGDGDSLYDAPVEPSGPVASQVSHFGLAVIADTVDGSGRILVDYSPCSEPRVEWALDPLSSCVAPGCSDPWAGPAITWTYQDGSMIDPPGFAERALSHVPLCDGNGNRCEGSGRFVAPGIRETRANLAVYPIATPYVQDDTTRYVNVLVVTGEYEDEDADVQSALEGAYGDGIVTYVVAYGSTPVAAFDTQLTSMAQWGSDGTLTHRVATNPGELDGVLDEIVAELSLPCCASIDCSAVGGADSGGDAGSDDAGADWGGADGTAGDGTGGSASGGTGATMDTSGEIDDDGGCTCRTGGGSGTGVGLLALLGLLRRRPWRARPRR